MNFVRAEIIAVGTELLMGQIANTNAQYLSQKLGELGIDVFFHSVVGDNRDRLLACLLVAASRSDLILLTGGLGPTQDDLTKEVVADFLQRNLVIDPNGMKRIEQFFQQRNIPMPENNIRQAQVIEGAYVLPNDHGLALGDIVTIGHQMYILLPGPPFEMQPMFENYVIPYLRKHSTSTLYSRILRFIGIGESKLVTELADLIDTQSDPTIAPYAKASEVTLRISTKAKSEDEANVKMKPIIDEIYARVGKYIYGEGDKGIDEVIIDALRSRNLTLSCAESCTGGLISQQLTQYPGASQFFKGSVVCYTNEAKATLLNVNANTLAQYGAVSEETAIELAQNVRKMLQSDWAISVTGVAGPDPSEDKPVGLVYVGIANEAQTKVLTFQFAGTRKTIQIAAMKHALFALLKRIKKGENE